MEHRPSEPGRASVARPHRLPQQQIVLPGVKLDLALVVLFLLCLWLALSAAALDRGVELALLFTGSVTASAWLVYRTRRALRRTQQERQRHGP